MEPSTVAAWITGVGAVLSAGAGLVLVLREVKSRERREIRRLDKEVADVRDELVAWRQYGYDLANRLADLGVEAPPHPTPNLSERDYSHARPWRDFR